jgi:Protein of unknown function (DUF3108)
VFGLQNNPRRALLAGLAFISIALPVPSCAQGRLEAHYEGTLAGITIGSGNWIVELSDTRYTAAANGKTTGLLRVITGGHGSSRASGTLKGNQLVSSTYATTIASPKKINFDEVQLTIINGEVKNLGLTPPLDNNPERVPVTDAHRRGIIDPMAALLFRAPGNGAQLSPEACDRTLAVFDGRLRYDLQLAFKRMDKVKAAKGYAGPVVVCAVRFYPVAGYLPSRFAIKYIAKSRDMEVWLAPVLGTRILVPFRAQAPTPIGHAVLEATQFIAVATPASANDTKTR